MRNEMFKTKLLLIGFSLAISGYVYAQAISSDFQKNCTQEQLQEHQAIKKKTLTEEDFKPYCTCLAEYISKNASSKQINELVTSPKSKPEWLKALELKTMKSCLASDSKMST
jgi:hypothetical protein